MNINKISVDTCYVYSIYSIILRYKTLVKLLLKLML